MPRRSISQLSLMQRKPNFNVKTKLRRKNKQSQWTMKYRSRAPCEGACLKGMSRTITMQRFTLPAITDVGKTKLRHKC